MPDTGDTRDTALSQCLFRDVCDTCDMCDGISILPYITSTNFYIFINST
jgi:hypothetical protein